MMSNRDMKDTRQEQLLIFLSMLMVIVTPFTSDSYTPSLPAMAKALHTSKDSMQLTMTLYLLGTSISQLIYGPLSDRFGRKPVILTGMLITLIGSLLCGAANSLQFILIARFIQGWGAGVCNSLFRALLRDSFIESRLAQVGSYAGMFYTVAFAGAPIIGGYIENSFGWRMNFLFVSVLMLLIFLLLWYLLKETHKAKDRTATQLKNIFKNYFTLLSSPVFVGYAVLSSFAFSGLIAYYTAGPFILQNVVGLTPVEFGWLSLGLAAGLFVGQYLNSRLVITKGISFMLWIGTSIMFLSGLVMLLFGIAGVLTTSVIIFPVALFCCSSAFVYANAMANAFQRFGHIAGIAGGMYGFLQIFGCMLTSIVVVAVHERTQVPLATIFTGLGLASLVLLYVLEKYQSRGMT